MAIAKYIIIIVISTLVHGFSALTVDDVIDTYRVVRHSTNPSLIKVEEECLAFVNQHPVEILHLPKALDLKLDEIDELLRGKLFIVQEKEFFHYVQKWIAHTNRSTADRTNVLKKVRLPDIDDDTLIMDVDDSKFFTRDEIFAALKARRKFLL